MMHSKSNLASTASNIKHDATHQTNVLLVKFVLLLRLFLVIQVKINEYVAVIKNAITL